MIERVRTEMVQAMKDRNVERKNSLSMLLQALQKKEKDKGSALTQSEADEVVLREIKQTQETLDSCPKIRINIIDECQKRLKVLHEFAPKQLTVEEIRAEIGAVIAELALENPTKKDKGKIMKSLMPRIKGKADGKVVNAVLDDMLN